jgi:hypothetical protein
MISRKRRGARALSVGVYDALLHAYPAAFRAEYANEMRWAFSHLCTDAIASRGLTGLLEVWLDTLVDFPASVVATHRERWQERAPLSWATPLVLTVLPLGALLKVTSTDAGAASFLHFSSIATYCGVTRLWLAIRGPTFGAQRIVFVVACGAAAAAFLKDARACLEAVHQSPGSIVIGFAVIAIPAVMALVGLRAAQGYLQVNDRRRDHRASPGTT